MSCRSPAVTAQSSSPCGAGGVVGGEREQGTPAAIDLKQPQHCEVIREKGHMAHAPHAILPLLLTYIRVVGLIQKELCTGTRAPG